MSLYQALTSLTFKDWPIVGSLGSLHSFTSTLLIKLLNKLEKLSRFALIRESLWLTPQVPERRGVILLLMDSDPDAVVERRMANRVQVFVGAKVPEC